MWNLSIVLETPATELISKACHWNHLTQWVLFSHNTLSFPKSRKFTLCCKILANSHLRWKQKLLTKHKKRVIIFNCFLVFPVSEINFFTSSIIKASSLYYVFKSMVYEIYVILVHMQILLSPDGDNTALRTDPHPVSTLLRIRSIQVLPFSAYVLGIVWCSDHP
jgi:hypothetical protein